MVHWRRSFTFPFFCNFTEVNPDFYRSSTHSFICSFVDWLSHGFVIQYVLRLIDHSPKKQHLKCSYRGLETLEASLTKQGAALETKLWWYVKWCNIILGKIAATGRHVIQTETSGISIRKIAQFLHIQWLIRRWHSLNPTNQQACIATNFDARFLTVRVKKWGGGLASRGTEFRWADLLWPGWVRRDRGVFWISTWH